MTPAGQDAANPRRVTALVRVSARARHMRLVALPGKGLELVVTPRTTQDEMQAFLAKHAAWAARTLGRLGAPLDAREALAPVLPAELPIRAFGEAWRIEYRPGAAPDGAIRLRFRETAGDRLVEVAHGGEAAHARTVVRLLLRYVRDRAVHALPPWVARVVRETGLPAPSRIRIGMQRTRWGSRSPDGTLSLSARLLFLSPELVRHVIVHELSHAGHMHHRASFHRVVERHDPDAARNRQALRTAGQLVPTWCAG